MTSKRGSSTMHRCGCKADLPELGSEAEVHRLVSAFIEGKTSVAEEDLLLWIDWARMARTQWMMLRLVLAGQVGACVQEGEVHFLHRHRN